MNMISKDNRASNPRIKHTTFQLNLSDIPATERRVRNELQNEQLYKIQFIQNHQGTYNKNSEVVKEWNDLNTSIEMKEDMLEAIGIVKASRSWFEKLGDENE